jgi:endonuclease VIII-like 1
VPYRKFYISAESRGKELMLTITDKYSENFTKLLMTMGMSGHFSFTNTASEPKHAHLMFYTDDGTTLSFVDVRRFGKWKFVNDWSTNRGPDPTKDFENFKENILSNINKLDFSKPIHLFLMNQKYCNGIGNYLRSEILYRLPCMNPWSSAKDCFLNEPNLFDLCRDIPLQAYTLGGGQLKDWENPFKNDPEPFRKFMRCYGNPNMKRIRDKNGRTFWYDPKWDEDNHF